MVGHQDHQNTLLLSRQLILHTGGIGAELIALITEECFDDLDARPIRLSSQDIPTPYNGNLENLTIIQPHQIVEKVEDLISGSI